MSFTGEELARMRAILRGEDPGPRAGGAATSAPGCAHAHTTRDGESYWCEDCGAFLPAGTSEWRVPRVAGIVDLQTRSLLAVEWEVSRAYGIALPVCRACRVGNAQREHHPSCALDAALTAAGLDTQEKRDAAREAMGGGR